MDNESEFLFKASSIKMPMSGTNWQIYPRQ